MPGFDGTGPMGMGPRTGGGFGYCSPGTGPAPVGYTPGVVYGIGRGGIPRGGGRGRAFGGGRGWWGRARVPYGVPAAVNYQTTYSPVDEKTYLENQVAQLEQQLAAIKSRLSEIGEQAEQD